MTNKQVTICQRCHERPGTFRWIGYGGALDYVHGNYEMWCLACVLRLQIKHAEERSAALPELRAQLEAEVAK